MNKYKILFSESAQLDLKEIIQYIAEESHKPSAARKQLQRIKQTIAKLAEYPERHGLVQDPLLALKGIRYIPVGSYLVFYLVSGEQKTVTIVRILYERQNWQHLL